MSNNTLTSLLFSFRGRANRKQFWMATLAIMLLVILVMLADMKLFGNGEPSTLTYVLYVLSFWPMYAIQVKRWHDRNKSGWWALLTLIPIIGAIWVLIECGFLAGTPGSNRFGEAPADG